MRLRSRIDARKIIADADAELKAERPVWFSPGMLLSLPFQAHHQTFGLLLLQEPRPMESRRSFPADCRSCSKVQKGFGAGRCSTRWSTTIGTLQTAEQP